MVLAPDTKLLVRAEVEAALWVPLVAEAGLWAEEEEPDGAAGPGSEANMNARSGLGQFQAR